MVHSGKMNKWSFSIGVLAGMIFLAGIACSEQRTETKVQVFDSSASDAPIRVLGNVVFNGDDCLVQACSLNTDIVFSNISRKPVLLVIVQLEFRSTYTRINYTENDDYFFESKLLEAGHGSQLQVVLPVGRSTGDHQVHPIVPRARGKVVFVQFLYGSRWGDANLASSAFESRIRSWKALNAVHQALSSGDESECRNELERTTELQPMLTIQDVYKKNKDLRSVSTILNQMLQNASSHYSSLRLLSR